MEIKGRGLPSIRGSRRGDVVILVKLDMPKKFSKEELKHIKAISKEKTQEEIIQRVKRDAEDRRN